MPVVNYADLIPDEAAAPPAGVASVQVDCPCPADAAVSPGLGGALPAAGTDADLPAVYPADVSASAAGGAVDPPAAALHADAVPDAADASPVGSAAPAPSEGELAAVAGPGPLSVLDLLDQSNLGKYVVYMATPSRERPGRLEKPGMAFVVVGKIVQAVWENECVWFDTVDKFASEDQHYPQTLVDAKWISGKRSTIPNWVDTQHDFVVCITDQLERGGVLPVAASSQALDVLRLSTDPTAAEFMTRLDAVRPKSTVKAKSRR